jgi:hypothetical protein
MKEDAFREICERHGTTSKDVRKNMRSSKLRDVKSKIVVELRDKHKMTYGEIAMMMGYFDKSGARQAYIYALTIL